MIKSSKINKFIKIHSEVKKIKTNKVCFLCSGNCKYNLVRHLNVIEINTLTQTYYEGETLSPDKKLDNLEIEFIGTQLCLKI